MWQPRGFGVFIGWLTLAGLAVFFFSDKLVEAGVFGEACRAYGLSSWSCGVLPRFIVWVPTTFIHFLQLPLTYDGGADMIGADYAMMWTGSAIAYAFAAVATNYWVWKLNEL
jgi:hypothetical protein